MSEPFLTGAEVRAALNDLESPSYLTDRERVLAVSFMAGLAHDELVGDDAEPATLAQGLHDAVVDALMSRARRAKGAEYVAGGDR